MDWLEAVVHTTTMGADIVSEVLMNAGAIGTAIEDRYDVTSSKKSDGMWDMIDEDVLKHMSEDVLVKAYFKSDASAPETLHLVEQKLGEIAKMDMGFDMGSLTLDTQGVREQDWAENWKKYYKPFRAGEHLVIKPSWEAYEPKEGDLVLELDPGMAFGTGTHETTFMCMEQLEKYITPGCRAIDVGCGSGILGLAAFLAMLGTSIWVLVKSRKEKPLIVMLLGACVLQMFGQAVSDVTWSVGCCVPTFFAVLALVTLHCGDSLRLNVPNKSKGGFRCLYRAHRPQSDRAEQVLERRADAR